MQHWRAGWEAPEHARRTRVPAPQPARATAPAATWRHSAAAPTRTSGWNAVGSMPLHSNATMGTHLPSSSSARACATAVAATASPAPPTGAAAGRTHTHTCRCSPRRPRHPPPDAPVTARVTPLTCCTFMLHSCRASFANFIACGRWCVLVRAGVGWLLAPSRARARCPRHRKPCSTSRPTHPPPPPPPRSWLGAAAVAGALTKFAVPLLPLSSCCSAAVTYTRSRVSEPADSLTCSQQGEARMPVHGPLVLPGAACLPSWCLQQHSTAHDTRPLRTERPLAHVYTEAVVWQDVYAPDVLQLCFDEEQERGHRCCWCALVCGGGATCVRACVRACVCPTDVRFST
jgi:hypothetical protein